MRTPGHADDHSGTAPDQGLVQPGQPPAAPRVPEDYAATRAHGGDGKFTEDPAALERHAEAARLRAQGWTWQRIADHLGYASRSSVHEAVTRYRNSIISPAIEEMRDAEDAKLDALEQACLEVLTTRHLKFHDGQALTHKGKPVVDDAQVLQATAQLLKIAERRARLWGLDAPVKTDIGGAVHVRYELPGVDMGQV